MKQVVVQSFCDPDIAENPDDEPVPATAEITRDGVVLDVCERHRVIVQGMLDELDQVFAMGSPVKGGRRPMRKGPPPVPKSRRGGNRVASRMKETEAWRTCPECGHIPPTRSALGAHMRSHHGARLRDYEWSTSVPT
jgi:hypothetical protein